MPIDTQLTPPSVATTELYTDRKTGTHIIGTHENLVGHVSTYVRADILSTFAFIWSFDSRALNGLDVVSRHTLEEPSPHNKTVHVEKVSGASATG
jgi:hypothetical protein